MMESIKQEPQLTEFSRKIFDAVISKLVIGHRMEDGSAVPDLVRFVYVNGLVDEVKFKGTSRPEKKTGYEYTDDAMEVNEERASYGSSDELTDIQRNSLKSMLTSGAIDQALYKKTANSLAKANRAMSGFAGG